MVISVCNFKHVIFRGCVFDGLASPSLTPLIGGRSTSQPVFYVERLCGPLTPVFWTVSLRSVLGLPAPAKEESAVGRDQPWCPG